MYFCPSNAIQPIQGLVERVEDVRLSEAGNDQRVDALQDLILVLGKVGDDLGMHVEGHHRNVVLGTQLLGKGPGGILHVVDEVIAVGGELAEQQRGDGSLDALKADDILFYAVLVHFEIVRLEARHELMGLLQEHAYVHGDFRNIDAQGDIAHFFRVFDFGSSRSWRRRLFGNASSFRDRNDSGIAGGAAG